MYYPDLSLYKYAEEGRAPSVLNVGWLSKKYAYPQGDVPEAFLERLWSFCRSSVLHMLGFHRCPFCTREPGILAQRGEEELRLGSGEIRVFGKGEKVYAAPNLIYHYVIEHHYYPPEEFIQAVMEGPLPGSQEYETLIKRYT